jgi:hypothetical protein
MKKISREQAEKLFIESEVVNSSIHQDKNQLRVIMNLSTRQSCHVTYDFKSKEKSYYLDDPGIVGTDQLSPSK